MSLSEWMVKQVTYPLHEKARGRDTLRRTSELAQLLQRSPAEVHAESMRRLRRQLEFANLFVPFYRARFARHGVEPDAADPLAELQRLPVLTKAEIRAARSSIVYRDSPGGPLPAVTGGTTGETLKFHTDRIRAASNMATRLWLQRQFGVSPGDRRIYLWGSPLEVRVSRVKRWRDRLLNEVVLNAFELTPPRMDEYVRRIRRYRPRLIYGFSSALALLAR
ncbi:MAG: capsular biosynthesis protein, partial [Phycisphaerae bacterium]|nr:capsular biosynthesis protein [Phycisphaerae bacterium]